MTDIQALRIPSNVTLLPGSMQYWSEPQPAGTGWGQVLAGEVNGSVLVCGSLDPEALREIAAAATSLGIVVRGAADAAKLGEQFPEATIWCGDLRWLAERFDTVVCLADAADVLSAESEPRDWRSVFHDLTSKVTQGGRLVALVTNDLGIHRLTAARNPRLTDRDPDWAPTTTWDASRPRTLEQVRQRMVCHEQPPSQVWCLWPSPAQPTALIDPAQVPTATHEAFATQAAVLPLRGPDPSFLVGAAAMSGRLADLAPAWLAVWRPEGAESAPGFAIIDEVVHPISTASGPGRVALQVFADLAANEDLAGIRALVRRWAEAMAGDELSHSASFAHLLISDDQPALVTPLVAIDPVDGADQRWRALAEVARIIRDRAWRTPWPSTVDPVRVLNHLGIMAGMHTLPSVTARSVIGSAPSSVDPLNALDRQGLVAQADRTRDEVDALRSKLRWTESLLDQARTAPAAPIVALARRGSRKASKVARGAARRAKGIIGR
ncbi:MAG: hypothetical protein ACK5KO_13525 [Arachnia sp.]